MFGIFGSIRAEIVQLIVSREIDTALSTDDINFRKGIIQRCIDYDKNYDLRRFSLSAHQRAVAALYVYSKELTTAPYVRLEAAVRSYAKTRNIPQPFTTIDANLTRIDGRLAWLS
jgi:hypothetical protein